MSDAPKRRLPVIGSSPPEEPEVERPPWHWSAIGAAAIFLAWLPLAALAAWLTSGMLGRAGVDGTAPAPVELRLRLLMIAVHVFAFGLACFAGGYLVGRFGDKAGVKEATVAGFVAAAVAWALAAAQPGQASPGALAWILILVAVAVLGTGVAHVGGRYGRRWR